LKRCQKAFRAYGFKTELFFQNDVPVALLKLRERHISQKLAKQLLNTAGIQLITKLKRTIKQRLMPLNDRLLLRKRTIIDQLKNISQIEHSRHRSPVNCFVNILSGLIAYCH
jgi:hypothetical protein